MASFQRLLAAAAMSALVMAVTACPASTPIALRGDAAGKSAAASLKAADAAAETIALQRAAAAQPAAAPVAAAEAQVSKAISAGAVPPLQIKLDWGPPDRQVQVSPAQVAGQTFVTMMDGVTGASIGGSISDNNGGFSLNFGGAFVPDSSKIYILEAQKGLGPPSGSTFTFNKPGYQSIRIRTLLRWAGGWESLGSGVGASIPVNRGTTALAALHGLRLGTAKALDTTKLFGSIQAGTNHGCTQTGGDTVTDKLVSLDANINHVNNSPASACTADVYSVLWKIADDALDMDQDPVAAIGMSTSNLDSFFPQMTPPRVDAISATTGVTTSGPTTFTIQGGPFKTGTGRAMVYLNGIPLTTTWNSINQVTVTLQNGCSQLSSSVPWGPCTAQQGGTAVPTTGPLAIGMDGVLTMTQTNFTVQPRYTSMSASSGIPGSTVAISGNGFDPRETTVNFTDLNGSNTRLASATVAKNGTSISAVVPRDACTGAITVTTPGGTVTTGTYTVLPVIEKLTTTGNTQIDRWTTGNTLRMVGAGFGRPSGTVEFGTRDMNGNPVYSGVPAAMGAISSWGPNQIDVVIPSGAMTGPIQVTQSGADGSNVARSQAFRIQFSVSGVSYSHAYTAAIVTITGSGFGPTNFPVQNYPPYWVNGNSLNATSGPPMLSGGNSGTPTDYRIEGVDMGAMARIVEWSPTMVRAAVYGPPNQTCVFRINTPGGWNGIANGPYTFTRGFAWNGYLSRRVVDAFGWNWNLRRSDNWIWKFPVNTAGQALRWGSGVSPGTGTITGGAGINSWNTNTGWLSEFPANFSSAPAALVLDLYDNIWVTYRNAYAVYHAWDRGAPGAGTNTYLWYASLPWGIRHVAVDSANNIYVKQSGGSYGSRKAAAIYRINTKTRTIGAQMSVQVGRSTYGAAMWVENDDNLYSIGVRQRCTSGSCGSGACTRVTRYDMQSGRYIQANTSYSGVTNPTCGSSSYRSGSYRYRHVTGGAVNRDGYKFVLRRYGGMERMNTGWGLDARNSGYRCNLWYGTGTDHNNVVYHGNNGCQGTTYQMAISGNWGFSWTSPGLGPGGHITW